LLLWLLTAIHATQTTTRQYFDNIVALALFALFDGVVVRDVGDDDDGIANNDSSDELRQSWLTSAPTSTDDDATQSSGTAITFRVEPNTFFDRQAQRRLNNLIPYNNIIPLLFPYSEAHHDRHHQYAANRQHDEHNIDRSYRSPFFF
jgi:hypothetical protein